MLQRPEVSKLKTVFSQPASEKSNSRLQRLVAAHGHSWEGDLLSDENRSRILSGEPPQLNSDAQLEFKNFELALKYVEELSLKNKSIDLAEMLEINRILMNAVVADAGQLRKEPASIKGPNREVLRQCPSAEDVPALLNELFCWLKENQYTDILTLAGHFHLLAVAIHPFTQGNGRTMRLLYKLMINRRDKRFQHMPLEVMLIPLRPLYCEVLQLSLDRGTALPITDFLNSCLFTAAYVTLAA
jgi:Fic family protein